jgi:hypothetical protein
MTLAYSFPTQPLLANVPIMVVHKGSVVDLANFLSPSAAFPAMTGHSMAIAQRNLGPCAMLPPHYHPCANNMVIAMSGNTTTWVVNKNGVRLMSATFTSGKMIWFPFESICSVQNDGGVG